MTRDWTDVSDALVLPEGVKVLMKPARKRIPRAVARMLNGNQRHLRALKENAPKKEEDSDA